MRRPALAAAAFAGLLQACAPANLPTRHQAHQDAAPQLVFDGRTGRYTLCTPPYCPGPTPKTPRTADRAAARPKAAKVTMRAPAPRPAHAGDTTDPARPERTVVVHFDHNSSVLPWSFAGQARRLASRPIEAVRITAYTDSTGEADYNQWLAERRARAVREALVRQGVPADRIDVEGRGYCCYVQSNATAEGRRANRRAEVVVTYQHPRNG